MKTDRIKELWGYMETMSPEELEERIKSIRSERRIRKTPAKKVVKARKDKASAVDKAKKKVASLSPEAMAALLAELENDSGNSAEDSD